MDNKHTSLTIYFNEHCFEKLTVADDKVAESFLYRADGIEVSEEEWKEQQDQELGSPPALATLHIR